MAQEMREAAAGGGPEEQQLANEMADAFLSDTLPENIFSSPKAGAGNALFCLFNVSHILWARAENVLSILTLIDCGKIKFPTLIPNDLNIRHLIQVWDTF